MKSLRTILFVVLFILILAACGGYEKEVSSREYILTTDLVDGNFIFLGVGGAINGVSNPTLTAEPGETITVTLVNGGHGKHAVYRNNFV